MPHPGQADFPTCDAVLTIRPWPCSFMIRPAAREQLITPLTLTANTRSITSSEASSTETIGCATPALFARMSSFPYSPTIPSTTAAAWAPSVTSSSTALALRPSGLGPSESATGPASRTSAHTTTAPSRLRARAIPSPSPRADPVTRAMRLSSRPISPALLSIRGTGRMPAARSHVPLLLRVGRLVGAELPNRVSPEPDLRDVALEDGWVRDEVVAMDGNDGRDPVRQGR